MFNPISAGGHNVPVLFSEGYFSMKKGVLRCPPHSIYIQMPRTIKVKGGQSDQKEG